MDEDDKISSDLKSFRDDILKEILSYYCSKYTQDTSNLKKTEP